MINENNIKETRRFPTTGQPNCKWLEFDGLTPAGEKLTVEVLYCRPAGEQWDKNDLPELWKKHGYIQKVPKNYICVNTYAEGPAGCFGWYNPTIKRTDDGKRNEINFSLLLEISEENETHILEEVANMANRGIKKY